MALCRIQSIRPRRVRPTSLIRLVLADVDGSLVTQDKVLTPRALAAAEALRNGGRPLGDHQRPPAKGHEDAD